VYKLRPNQTQNLKMSNWVDMLRSHYNWYLNERTTQYHQQFIQGNYCEIRTKSEACPLTSCISKNGATGSPWKSAKTDQGCISKNGATGSPWKSAKTDQDGKVKNPRRNPGDIQITALPELKTARPWFAGIDSTVLQQNVKRLDTAYKNFFEGRGFPKFKNRSNFTSFTFVMGVKIQGNKIYLPKLGWMRFYNSRPIPNGFTIKACAVRKRQNGWYVSIRIEDKSLPDYLAISLKDVVKVIGCDMGITKLVHLSDGFQIENPKFSTTKKAKRTLKIRQRRASLKAKGSKTRKKAAKRVGSLHQKISDKRQAHHWKVANKTVSSEIDGIA